MISVKEVDKGLNELSNFLGGQVEKMNLFSKGKTIKSIHGYYNHIYLSNLNSRGKTRVVIVKTLTKERPIEKPLQSKLDKKIISVEDFKDYEKAKQYVDLYSKNMAQYVEMYNSSNIFSYGN